MQVRRFLKQTNGVDDLLVGDLESIGHSESPQSHIKKKMEDVVTIVLVLLVILVLEMLLTGCSPAGVAMRQSPSLRGSEGEAVQLPKELGKRSYIETVSASHPYSCSFVEFDGRGDFLQFEQHDHCWKKIRSYAADEGVLLVIYCHGWKNNSQSSDVLRFNEFLSRLAASDKVVRSNMRVHGVYLSWQGNLLKPQVDVSVKNDLVEKTLRDFDGLIVDPKKSRRLGFPGSIVELLSYWNRKKAAEHRVSGIPITRAVLTYANAAQKTPNRRGRDNQVFLMGHSFGALMLEQSVLPGVVSSLTDKWDWKDGKEFARNQRLSEVLPFDLILLVNSAAPSIYAKEMSDFLAAHGRARGSKAPVVVSLTSRSDWATRGAHRVANVLSPLSPSMQRQYPKRVWDRAWNLESEDKNRIRDSYHPSVHQSEFYKRTPGHNPFLINRWIARSGRELVLPAGKKPFDANLELRDPENGFFVESEEEVNSFRLVTIDPALNPNLEVKPEEVKWHRHKGENITPFDTPYWIIRCEKELINSHGDIWDHEAMDVYAALFRMSELR